MRTGLVAAGASLAIAAVWIAGLPGWLALGLSATVIGVSLISLRRAPRAVQVTFPEAGRLAIRPRPDHPVLRGAFDALYASGPYCAFRVRDAALGARVVGLFRDELTPDHWRRLQVALRAG